MKLRISFLLPLLALNACSTPQQPPAASPESAPSVESAATQADEVRVFAAGSLRDAFTAIGQDYQARTGQPISFTFNPAGLLRERIEQGEQADVFASANMAHPEKLAQAGGWSKPVAFVRNELCLTARPGISVSPGTVLDVILRPDVKLGTSTPGADPGGDYTWQLFRRADKVKPGAYAALDAKALKLVGGPTSEKAPAGRHVVEWAMSQGRADVFIGYCTTARQTLKKMPTATVTQMPPELAVGATYGLSVRDGAPAAARSFADSLLQPAAQKRLLERGFVAP